MAAYTRTAIGLHWLVAFVVIATLLLGLNMTDMPLSPQKLKLYSYHKWMGVTVFALTLLRLVWRLAHPAPPYARPLPAWQLRAAMLGHGLLYAALLAVPLSGWLYSSAAGVQTVWFGLAPLPNLVDADKALAETLKRVHYILNTTLFVLFCVHVAAALKHHFIDRNDVLIRMLPILRK